MVGPSPAGAWRRTWGALQRRGMLLLTDPALPSVAGLVAGRPVRGSWWAHPAGGTIFAVATRLEDHADVTGARLIAGKVTFVHRRLWPALAGVGAAQEPWQLQGLDAEARRLLRALHRVGEVRTDAPMRGLPQGRELARAALVLERRLLAHGETFHTPTGAHARRLATWAVWARRRRMRARALPPPEGKAALEDALASLTPATAKRPRLPWQGRVRSSL